MEDRKHRDKLMHWCSPSLLYDKGGRNTDNHIIVIKGSIHQEDIKILNFYSVNKSFKMQKVKTDRTIRINIQIYPQASSEVSILHFQELNSKKTENQKEFRRLENHNQQIWSNWYSQKNSSINRRVDMILTWTLKTMTDQIWCHKISLNQF